MVSQGPADGARRTDESLEPSQVMTHSFGDQRRQSRSAARPQPFALHADLREGRRTEPEHDALDAFIADQDVAAAAQDAQRDVLLDTPAHHGPQLRGTGWLDERLRRPA